MILDSLDELNWAAVGTTSIAAFAIGAVWFSPSVLGGFWARQVARYTGAAAADITAAAARPASLAKWLAGLAVGLGATFSSWPPVFARMPWGWWLVNNGAFVLMLAAIGAILGAWR
jgi:hypothetical protein